MNFTCVAKKLKIEENSPFFNLHAKFWSLSQNGFDEKELFFLHEKYISRVMQMLNMPDEAILSAVDAAMWIRQDDILNRIIWHSYYILFLSNEFPHDMLKDWQLGLGYDGKLDDFICLFLAFAGIPKMKEIYFKLRIPDNILIDTLDYIKIWMEEFKKKYGRWGFNNFLWYFNHQQKCNLFRIGRLEFEITKFRYNIKSYRNKSNSSIIAFWEEKMKFRSDGQIDGTNGDYEKSPNETVFTENDNHIYGNPINSSGYIENYTREYSKKEWELILEKNDPVLSIHIPGKGKLEKESVNASYKQAIIFFKEYFPQIKFRAFYCGTWFLDPQFKKMLGEETNIAYFQKPFYLFPTLSDDNGVFHWVFGKKPDDLNDLPQRTGLHKAIINHYKEGKKLRTSTGFIPLNNQMSDFLCFNNK